MTKVLLDGNIYDRLRDDTEARNRLALGVEAGQVRVIATPVVAGELAESPFGGIPTFFPVSVEPEAVAVCGYARFGMARMGSGETYSAHRGQSKKIKDAILADSADKLADMFVSDDGRCRGRLARLSSRCRSINYSEFRAWVLSQPW